MSLLKDILEKKFDEAEHLYMQGKPSIFVQDAALKGLRYEIIGLDCEDDGKEADRFLVSRCSLYTKPVGFSKGTIPGVDSGFDVTNTLVRLTRMPGDHRKFEKLTDAAGVMLLVDAERDIVVEYAGETIVWDEFAVQALARQLSGLRVAERVPNFTQ